MQSWIWRAMLFGALASVLIYAAVRPDPETDVIASGSSQELISLLRSSRDVIRRGAAARLLAQGAAVVPDLVAAARKSDAVELEQIMLVLEDLYMSSDDRVSEAAEAGIEELAASDHQPLRRVAEDLFQMNIVRRQLRACAKIESFGGRFLSSPGPTRPGEMQYSSDIAVIGADWTGGDDGLKYVERIRGALTVHVADAAPISPEALEKLGKLYSVRRERDACLGVELRERDGVLFVRRVATGSPADRARLLMFDRIVEMSDAPVNTYVDFITQLRKVPPGGRISLTIQRDQARHTLEVILGSDFGTGRCSCLDEQGAEVPAATAVDTSLDPRLLPTTDRMGPFNQGDPRHPQNVAPTVVRPPSVP